MATFIFANNIDTTLAGGISSASTSLTLSSTQNLPASVPAGSYLVLTLNDQSTRTNYEIVYVTAISGATLTVLRGQEGTAAKAWITGDYAFSGPTAGQMANFMQGAATGVTPGTYGNSTTVPQITVNAQGLVSNVTNVSIAFPITSFNGRAGAIVLNSGDVTSALGFNPVNKAGDTMTGALGITTSGSVATLVITDTGTNGANLRFNGSGATTPNKTIRASGGNLEFVNSGYTGVIATLTDNGSLSLNGNLTVSGSATFNGTPVVNSTGAEVDLFLQYANSPSRRVYISNNSGGFGINFTDASGSYLGSGLKMDNTNGNLTALQLTISSNSTSALVVNNGGSFRIVSSSGSSKYMRTNPSNASLEFVNNAYSSVIAWLGDDGTWNSVAGANFFASDENLKYDINRAANPRPLHHDAPWATYRWKRDNVAGTGPIAQDVRAVAPEYVREEADIDGKPFLMLDKPAVVQEVAYWAAHGVDGLLRRVTELEDAVFGRG